MPEEKERKFAKDFLEKWSRAEREEGPADQTLKRIDEELERNPNDPKLWFRRGVTLLDLDRWADALKAFRRVESIDPKYPRLYVAESLALSRLGQTEDAVVAHRKALEEAARTVDVDLADSLVRKEGVEEALEALAQDLLRVANEEEAVKDLEELGEITEQLGEPDADLEEKLKAWAAAGYDVAPLRDVLAKDPDRVRTAFFQFEQNVRKVEVLRTTLEALAPAGLEDDIARVRELFRTPYQIWRVEAEMATLLEKADARDRARRPRVGPAPAAPPPTRPRVPGAINGRGTPGRVNGLINGVRSARTGLTNGLTNGLGFTNGLGSRRFLVDTRRRAGRLLLVPLAAIFLLSVALILPPESPGGPGIPIDGTFADWAGVPRYDQPASAANPDVDLRSYAVDFSEGRLSVYARVAGTFFDDSSLHEVWMFLDADGDPTTGYAEGRLGADAAVEIFGGNRSIRFVESFRWDDAHADRDDWNGWLPGPYEAVAAVAGSELEFQIDVSGTPFDEARAAVALYVDDQTGSRSTSMLLAGPAYGALEVVQTTVGDVVLAEPSRILAVTFRAVGAPVTVTGITSVGGASTPALTPDVPFPFALAAGATRQVNLTVDATGIPAQTLLTARVGAVAADRPATISGPAGRAYVGSLPSGKVIDGLFGDWIGSSTTPDPNDMANPDLDIVNHTVEGQGNAGFLYLSVRGEALAGSPAPVARSPARPGGPSSAPGSPGPRERRAGEDQILAYFDADPGNDGILVGNFRADALLAVYGRNGRVTQARGFTWQGTWSEAGTVLADSEGSEFEASIDIPGITFQGTPYTLAVRDWKGTSDTTPVGAVRGVRSSSGDTTFVGSYLAVVPASPDGFRFEVRGVGLDWGLPNVAAWGDTETRVLAVPGPGLKTRDGFDVRISGAYGAFDMNVEYRAEVDGLKEVFVLAAAPTLGSGETLAFDFPFAWDGDLLIDARGTETGRGLSVSGPLAFVDGRGRQLVLPAPWAEDASGSRVDGSYLLSEGRLAVLLPGGWFLSANYPVAVDPTVRTLENDGPSHDPGEQLGWSVAIGDFNGDGYADVLAGAPSNDIDGGSPPHGYAYIWFGPITADDASPDVRIKGTTPNGRLGYSVAAGKFNNDAYWDALVATLSVGSFTANVSLYYGSATWSGLEDTPDVEFVPPASPASFGFSVAAGNLDNANYDDVLIAEPGRDLDANTSQDGVVYVYMSPFAASETSSDYRLVPSTNAGGSMGRALAVGKIDDDAYPDVVVGEPLVNSNKGRIQFYKGTHFISGSGDVSPDATIDGFTAGDQFGTALSAGTVNGDAYADVAVGAPINATSQGTVYLYLANADGSGLTNGETTPDATFTGETSGDRFGTSVLLFDWDADGSAGLWVGAPLAEGGGTNRGKAYWYDDPANDQTADDSTSGLQDNERLGQSLAGGKFSADSRPIVAIGAYLWDDGADADTGRVVVAEVPEPAALIVAAMIPLVFGVRLVQRRRLVRQR